MDTSHQYDFSHWETPLPKVSCICITYGRPHILGEAIESFLKQDYPGEKELIILNDHPEVILNMSSYPEITLVNHPERFESIGLKRNAATELSSGDIIFPWDDDDICLPWRISKTLEKMKDLTYFKPSNLWWWDEGTKSVSHFEKMMAHAMCAYHRDLFDRLEGYTDFNSGEDQEFENRIAASHRWVAALELEEIFYIYRMEGPDTYHLSDSTYGGGLDDAEAYVAKSIEPGTYEITPSWSHPFAEICFQKRSSSFRDS